MAEKSADYENAYRETAHETKAETKTKRKNSRSVQTLRHAAVVGGGETCRAEELEFGKAAEGGARRLFVADGAGKMRKLQQNEGKEPVKRAEPRFRRNPTIRSSSTARRK